MVLALAACGTGGKVSGSADVQNGKALFQQKCAGCHALAAVGSAGGIGPNLDDSFAEARSEGFKESTIANIVHDQIRFPGQYATAQNNPNYLTANMPANGWCLKKVSQRNRSSLAPKTPNMRNCASAPSRISLGSWTCRARC
jgi:mono/diheme cytochrome c family protein